MGQVPEVLIAGSGRMARHMAAYFEMLGMRYSTWKRGEARPTDTKLALCLVSDGAIDDVAKFLDAKVCIHFSGSHTSPYATSYHPLCSLSKDLFDKDFYESIPFAIEEGAPPIQEHIPELKNPCFVVPKEERAKYHALAVVAGNFSCLLWQALMDFLPKGMANAYLTSVTRNLLCDPKGALTGPLVRGDQETIQKNLQALKGSLLEDIYRNFCSYYEEIP